jgi:hypothetical protein
MVAAVGSLGCALTRLGQDGREQPRALLAAFWLNSDALGLAVSKPTYPATIDTLGKLIEHGMGAFLSCPTCSKAGRLDVRDIDPERLAERVGRDRCFINRRWPVRCATCGERNVDVRIMAPTPSHPRLR